MSILSQLFNIIIEHGFSALGHVREVVYGLNDTYKRLTFHLMTTVQITVSKWFDTQMALHTVTQNTDVSLALKFQKHFSNK